MDSIRLDELRKIRPDINQAARFAELIFSKRLDNDIKVFGDYSKCPSADSRRNSMNLYLSFNDPTIHTHEFVHMLESKEYRNYRYFIRVNSSRYREGRAKFVQEIYRKLQREIYDIANTSKDFQLRQFIIDELNESILVMAKEFDPKRLPETPKDRGFHSYLIPDSDAPDISFLKQPIVWTKYVFFYKSIRKIAIEVNDCVKAFEITTNKVPGLFGQLFSLIYYRKEIEAAKKSD